MSHLEPGWLRSRILVKGKEGGKEDSLRQLPVLAPPYSPVTGPSSYTASEMQASVGGTVPANGDLSAPDAPPQGTALIALPTVGPERASPLRLPRFSPQSRKPSASVLSPRFLYLVS